MWRITAAMLAFLVTPLTAQTSGRGTIIRVHRFDASTVTGRYLERRGDSLVVEARGGPLAIPTTAIERIDRSAGTGNHALLGAAIGAAAGTATAVAFLDAFCGGDSLCDGDEQVRAVLIFGLPPLTAGAIIGTLIKKERWERIEPARLTIAPGPRGKGVAVGMRVPLRR